VKDGRTDVISKHTGQLRGKPGPPLRFDADLVSNKEADAETMVLFWQSANPDHIAQLADALKKANVPHYSRFAAGTKRPLWAGLPVARLFTKEKAAGEQGQIFVLASDLCKARRVAYSARIQPAG
jgi:hypothetical protein